MRENLSCPGALHTLARRPKPAHLVALHAAMMAAVCCLLLLVQRAAPAALHASSTPPNDIVPPPQYSPLSETVYALHKPRNVVSAVGDNLPIGRRGKRCQYPTLTDVMLDAGVEPLTGHAGRLDAETSGLILITSDSLLLRAILGWSQVLDAFGGTVVTKRYSLLLAGRHPPDSPQLASLSEPLTHQRGRKEYYSDGAVSVEHRGCFVDVELASGEHALIDRSDAEAVEQVRARMRKPAYSRATGERVPPYAPHDGWLTRVELELSQGRHHQVRRLARRAGLKLLHLKRVAVGPIELAADEAPGSVRVLGSEEKGLLYAQCLPSLI